MLHTGRVSSHCGLGADWCSSIAMESQHHLRTGLPHDGRTETHGEVSAKTRIQNIGHRLPVLLGGFERFGLHARDAHYQEPASLRNVMRRSMAHVCGDALQWRVSTICGRACRMMEEARGKNEDSKYRPSAARAPRWIREVWAACTGCTLPRARQFTQCDAQEHGTRLRRCVAMESQHHLRTGLPHDGRSERQKRGFKISAIGCPCSSVDSRGLGCMHGMHTTKSPPVYAM